MVLSQNGFRKILTDPSLNQQLIENGYVIVPWLDPTEAENLRQAYSSLGSANQREAFTSFACNDEAYRASVDTLIKDSFSRPFGELLTGYYPFWGNFFTKTAGTEAMPLHADLQYVNEPSLISLNIWCPLVDTIEENGAFGVVPRSHRTAGFIRGVRVSQYYARYAKDIQDELGVTLKLRAGEAVIYDHRLLHYSLANRTAHQRLAATLVAIPHQAEVLHYYADTEGGDIDEYTLSNVSDLLRTPFYTRPEHLSETRKIEGRVFPDLTPEDVMKAQTLPSDIWAVIESTQSKAFVRWRNQNHRILQDEPLNAHFVRRGYAVVPGFADTNLVAQLSNFYLQEYTTKPGMYVTHFSEDIEKNRETSNEIFRLLKPSIERLIKSCRPIIAHYAVKSPNKNTGFDLHQDWGIVDEEDYGVAHIWVALTDVGPENGGLLLVPNSHLAVNPFRSGSIPIRFLPCNQLEDNICQFRLKAGDAVIYHPAVFHGSLPNNGNNDRVAVIAAVCHEDAQLLYFHGNDNKIEVYPLSEKDMFSKLPHLAQGGLPESTPSPVEGMELPHWSDTELLQILKTLQELFFSQDFTYGKI